MTSAPSLGPFTADHAQGAAAPLAVGAAVGGVWWLRHAGQLTKLRTLFRRRR